ncbi:GNAT family N-acetyltransferase [Demequina sp.]|uniref:GNAT family N-acetyltransferase n=1 Tax=Demequina sp. TaxID=2050685 RepID=UPI003D0B267D
MSRIRPATPADHAQIARICLLTGATGADATGVFGDDQVLADVYATPYLQGPGCFVYVWDVDGEARGYVLGTTDTRAFQTWFSDTWWPRVAAAHPVRTAGDEWLVPSAEDPERMIIPQLDDYPAHLHIDLLPDQQGKGGGRQLIEAAAAHSRDAGAAGLHLVAEKANAGAQEFYPRVGFTAIDEDDAVVTFGMRL